MISKETAIMWDMRKALATLKNERGINGIITKCDYDKECLDRTISMLTDFLEENDML